MSPKIFSIAEAVIMIITSFRSLYSRYMRNFSCISILQFKM